MKVFPAPAGVILYSNISQHHRRGFPRTCGGDPQVRREPRQSALFSPHLRG